VRALPQTFRADAKAAASAIMLDLTRWASVIAAARAGQPYRGGRRRAAPGTLASPGAGTGGAVGIHALAAGIAAISPSILARTAQGAAADLTLCTHDWQAAGNLPVFCLLASGVCVRVWEGLR